MNKLFLALTGCFLVVSSVKAQLTNTTGQPTGAPVAEVMHERQEGYIVLTNGDTLKGNITHNEFAERKIYISLPEKTPNEKREVITFETTDSIQSMYISGRGYFTAVDLFKIGKMKLAFISETNLSYTEYKFFQSGAGLLGNKISGGNVQGTYDIFIYLNKKETLIKSTEIKDLKKNIDTYMDCPDINTKVKNEEKGYKQNLMNPAYIVLKKLLIESQQTCS